MIPALILAAGASRRMGTQKLLLPWNGVPVLCHIALQLEQAGVNPIHVVSGHDHEKLQQALEGLSITFTRNADYESGMLSSVRCGIQALPPTAQQVLIALGDHPQLDVAVVQALLQTAAAHPEAIVVPMHEGRKGHPIVLPRRYWSQLMDSYDDVGLRGLLRDEADSIIGIGAPASIREDLDTPEDYERALAAIQQAN